MGDALVGDTLERIRLTLAERYSVERELGRGGMATVFLAQDLRHERPVAIKVLKPELSVSLGADRFLREIKLAAQLQHPNILGLFDSGEADGLLYYVMPFVEGESLRDKLDREQQLSIEEAIQIIREAADGLGYAHSRGVVHRDIKPENILISGGHALVADFGIARAVSEAGGQKLTETGMAVGTPYYMSPEQAMGGGVDARSDIYSLGCVLYELLSGTPPFTGPTAMAIIARHSLEAIPSIQIVRPAVPDEVEAIIMKALAKTPADRFRTMQELGDALREADYTRVTRRTAARMIATTELPVIKPDAWRSRAWTYAMGAAAMLVLGMGGVAAWHRFGAGATPRAALAAASGLDPKRVAVLYFQDAGGNDSLQYLADGLTEGLIRELSHVQRLSVISKNGVAAYRGDSIPRDSVARALKAGTLVAGTVERAGDRLRLTVRLVDGPSGADIKRLSFEQPATNVLAVQDSLAQNIARALRELLGEEIRLREQQASTADLGAWTLVQRAEQARKRAEALAAQKGTSGAVAREFERADTLYAEANTRDPRWADPLVGRGFIAYRRSRLAGLDQLAAKPWIAKGLQFADEALALASQDPDALELRGTLRYWSWLLVLEPDPAKAKQLLNDAQSDFETAVRIRPSQAGAWAALSHLYNQTKGETDAMLAARRAYEEDAYLSNADQVISRLFNASYDLSQFRDADHWCEVGQQRFPTDFKFVACQLWLLTTKAKEPDVALAWKLADSLTRIAPGDRREFQAREGRMNVAVVLARAGLKDSARHVALQARAGADVDPTHDLAWDETYMRILVGDRDEAFKLLKSYLAANPERRASLADNPSWWFRDIQNDPRFEALTRGT